MGTAFDISGIRKCIYKAFFYQCSGHICKRRGLCSQSQCVLLLLGHCCKKHTFSFYNVRRVPLVALYREDQKMKLPKTNK